MCDEIRECLPKGLQSPLPHLPKGDHFLTTRNIWENKKGAKHILYLCITDCMEALLKKQKQQKLDDALVQQMLAEADADTG